MQRIQRQLQGFDYLTDRILDESEFSEAVLRSSLVKEYIQAEFSSQDTAIILRVLENRELIAVHVDAAGRKVPLGPLQLMIANSSDN